MHLSINNKQSNIHAITKVQYIQKLLFKAKLVATKKRDYCGYMLVEGVEYALIDNRINRVDIEFLKSYIINK